MKQNNGGNDADNNGGNDADNIRNKIAGSLHLKIMHNLFLPFISKLNGVLVENAEDLDVVMPMYNFLEYRKNYSKIYFFVELL